jgi:hypothetical protein
MKLIGLFIFGLATSLLAQIGVPSFSQGVIDTVLIMLAGGILKLLSQGRKILASVRNTEATSDRHEHRLNDHQLRLHEADGKEESPYHPS